MRLNGILLLLLIVLGCNKLGKTSPNAVVPSDTTSSQQPKNLKAKEGQSEISPKYNTKNSIGVIIAHVGDDLNKPLSIYNKDGRIWFQVAFEGVNKKNMNNLNPFAKDEDTYLLALKCIGIVDGFYKVVVNEQVGTEKYIKVTDKSFKLQKWPDHILMCFSVNFNHQINPIRTKPVNTSSSILYDKDEFYHPVKIQENWLQIKWGNEGNWEYGWIRWNENDNLILELFYKA